MQKVKEDIKSHTDTIQGIVKEADSILSSGSPGNLQELAKSEAMFRGKWADLNRDVTELEDRFNMCLKKWSAFKGIELKCYFGR